jgi:hypothetical protein
MLSCNVEILQTGIEPFAQHSSDYANVTMNCIVTLEGTCVLPDKVAFRTLLFSS